MQIVQALTFEALIVRINLNYLTINEQVRDFA